MSSELKFILLIAAIVIAALLVVMNRRRIRPVISNQLSMNSTARRSKLGKMGKVGTEAESGTLTEEEKSKAELDRLQKLIQDRKKIARDTDISYHLWDFYKSYFRDTSSHSSQYFIREGDWYDVEILKASTGKGSNKFEFNLKGDTYTFVDDEESRAWADKVKVFSLCLYDDQDRCLIEIPMKVKVDRWGKQYSVLSEGPKAFIPDEWVNNFINVKLKQQHIHNQEIREQKHRDRLWEIEELKERFGITD